MSINDITGEFLRGPENDRRHLTVPERARLGIVTLACQPAYNHPWAQEITVAENQKKAARAVDRVYGQVDEIPFKEKQIIEQAVENAAEFTSGQVEIPEATRRQMQSAPESPVSELDTIRAAIEDAHAKQSS